MMLSTRDVGDGEDKDIVYDADGLRMTDNDMAVLLPYLAVYLSGALFMTFVKFIRESIWGN